MDIKYIGHSSFFIRTKDAKIVTDPFSPSIGLKFPKTEADIVTLSHGHDDHNYREGIKGDALFLDWPGEFEKNKVRIFGFQSFHDKKQGEERGMNTMYKFEADDISILHCGDLGHKFDDATLEAIGKVDILLIPTGGFYTINAEEAAKITSDIEPSIVIPMHYKQDGLTPAAFGELQAVTEFTKALGAENVQTVDKLTVKKEDMNPDEMKVIVMSMSSS